jgi:GNAT superfamily N-acetyltransferase
MTLAPADWRDILEVLHETHRIWSPGLTRSVYHQYIGGQLSNPWSRKNFRYICMKVDERPAVSCKLYSMNMSSRGRDYRILALGAVFTLERFRMRGLAHQFIDEVVDLAEQEDYDGLILYSEIDPKFYEGLGFAELGAADFYIYLPHPATWQTQNESAAKVTRSPQIEDVAWLERHHQRWLRAQPYGVIRDADYWRYKLQKERFLHQHSKLSWPQLQLTLLEGEHSNDGYMLTEEGGSTIRLLELVGTQSARDELWGNLLHRAKNTGMARVRGWESGICDLAPGFSLSQFAKTAEHFEPLQYAQRDWGRPMLLPLTDELESWLSIFPCPLLEIDMV